MGRRAVGLGFCAIAAFLFAAKYVTAAIYGSSNASQSRDLFSHLLQYTGSALVVLSVISLIIGIMYLVWAEFKH